MDDYLKTDMTEFWVNVKEYQSVRRMDCDSAGGKMG